MGAEQNSMYVYNFAHGPSSYHNSYGCFTVSVHKAFIVVLFIAVIKNVSIYHAYYMPDIMKKSQKLNIL